MSDRKKRRLEELGARYVQGEAMTDREEMELGRLISRWEGQRGRWQGMILPEDCCRGDTAEGLIPGREDYLGCVG